MKVYRLGKLGLMVGLLVAGFVVAFVPVAGLAVDYVIDGTGGDCASLGGVWETAASPPRCSVDGWTLASGNRLVVEADAALHLGGSNLNAGTIYNDGTIEIGETYDVNRSTITNTGVISNTGIIRVGAQYYAVGGGDQGAGTVTNRGSIENAGTIEIGGSSVVTSTGTITNLATGTIRNRADRVLPYGCCKDGRLENGGTLRNAGTVYVEGVARNLGSIDNGPTGAIKLQLYGFIDFLGRGGGFSAATLENDGAIDNSGTLDNHGGNVSNQGTIYNGGAFRNFVEFFLSNTVAGAKVWRFGHVGNDTTVANSGVIVECGDIWDGNAPEGNAIVRQSCIAFLPGVEKPAK